MVLKNVLFSLLILFRWLFGSMVSMLVLVGRFSVMWVVLWLFCN